MKYDEPAGENLMKPTLRLELQQVPPDEPQDDWLGPMTEAVQAVEYCPHCEHSPCCQPQICSDTKAFESTGE